MNTHGRPKGGVLSDDVLYEVCPSCDRNRTGLFTERSPTQIGDWHCVKCGTTFCAGGAIVGEAPVDSVPTATPVRAEP